MFKLYLTGIETKQSGRFVFELCVQIVPYWN